MAVCDVIVWLLAVGVCVCCSVCGGVVLNVCPNNTAGLTPQQVAHNLSACSDKDHNSLITPGEVALCFADMLGAELPFPESQILQVPYELLLLLAGLLDTPITVSRDRFLAVWTARFHDNTAFASAFFDRFDGNNDNIWELSDLDSIVRAVFNGAGGMTQEMTSEEFTHSFVTRVYGDGC